MGLFNTFRFIAAVSVFCALPLSDSYAQSATTSMTAVFVSPVPSAVPSVSPSEPAPQDEEATTSSESPSGLKGFENMINKRACVVLSALSQSALDNPDIAEALCELGAETQYRECLKETNGDPLVRRPNRGPNSLYRPCLAKLKTTLEGCEILEDFSQNVIEACDNNGLTVFHHEEEDQFLNADPYNLDEPFEERG